MQHPHDFSVETNTPHLALTDASRCSLLLGTTSQPLSSLGRFICPKTHYSNDYQQTQDTSFLQSIRTQYIDLHLGRSRLWTCLNHQKWKSQAAERKTPPPTKKRWKAQKTTVKKCRWKDSLTQALKLRIAAFVSFTVMAPRAQRYAVRGDYDGAIHQTWAKVQGLVFGSWAIQKQHHLLISMPT